MKLRESISHYIAWRRAHGAKFKSQAAMLHQFCKQIDPEAHCDAVTTAQVCKFLAGNGTLSGTRRMKYSTLAGFYRYAMSRGHAQHSSALPRPDTEPSSPPPAPPNVYSKDELYRLFKLAQGCQKGAIKLDAFTFRTLLLLLYFTGLRVSEALHLALEDVDLETAVLTVRNAKFNKSRLVPIGVQITGMLKSYAAERAKRPLPKGIDSTFLAYLDGTPLVYRTVSEAFAKLLDAAEIQVADDGRQNPGLHGLRHTFAVHRLTSWYREGADVQRLLPVLSTYLGHSKLNGTQVYLSMTPDLLQEASSLFNQYVNGEDQ